MNNWFYTILLYFISNKNVFLSFLLYYFSIALFRFYTILPYFYIKTMAFGSISLSDDSNYYSIAVSMVIHTIKAYCCKIKPI